MTKILLLTGPGGSGKSTVGELLAKRSGFVYLDGDNEDTEFFPDGKQWLPENVSQLQKAHEKILKKTMELVGQGNNVVIDYIIFGRYIKFIQSFRDAFDGDFVVKVLFPSKEELIKRDADRECWTTGKERIDAVYEEFEAIRHEIGAENYLETSGQSVEETVNMILSETQ